MKKICFKCLKEKDITGFYKHPQMGDGHLNKCKDCTKEDVREHRKENIESIRIYDRTRNRLPHRLKANDVRNKARIIRNPVQYAANYLLSNAVRDNRIEKEPCNTCGAIVRVEGHHEDYYKPLDVIWLCSVHHSAIHKKKKPHKELIEANP